MAVALSLVLCDVLCFLHSKQGKLNVKQLKSALVDFYTPEDISVAKVRLLMTFEALIRRLSCHMFRRGVTEINAWCVKFTIQCCCYLG